MNIQEFTINGQNLLNEYNISDLISFVKSRKIKNETVYNFNIKYTVPNTAYPFANDYEYRIYRFDDINDFVNKYMT